MRTLYAPPAGPPKQVKTFNLAGLFRFPTEQGPPAPAPSCSTSPTRASATVRYQEFLDGNRTQ